MGWFGVLARRAAGQRMVLAAAFLMIVIATTLLATLGRFTAAIGDVALRSELASAGTDKTVVLFQGVIAPGKLAAGEQAARGYQIPGFPGAVDISAQSTSFALPAGIGSAAGEQPALTSFWTADDITKHAELAAGVWPESGPGAQVAGMSAADGGVGPSKSPPGSVGGTVDVAIGQQVADMLHLRVGAEFAVVGRLDPHPTVAVRVVGVFQARNSDDPFWRLDPFGGHGMQKLGYSSYGPLVVSRAEFANAALMAQNLRVEIFPDLSRIRAADIRPLLDSLNSLTARAHEDAALGNPDTATELTGLLTPLPAALVVNKSGMLIPALQLLALAGAALLLTARLLLEQRRIGTALMRSRGAGTSRLISMALVESLVLTLPTLAIAPFAAQLLMPLLPKGGSTAADAIITPNVSGATFAAALAAAILCVAALVVPAMRTGESYLTAQAGRSARNVALRRAGADFVVVVLAGVAFWQMRHYSPVSSGAGTPRIDPMIVAGPALVLLAGAVVVMRLLPAAGRVTDLVAARRRRLAGALASWEIGRGARRHAGPVLLLVMAFAMTVFAFCYGTTWRVAQEDQADFAVGTDVRVVGTTMPALGQGGGIARVSGVVGAAPVIRMSGQVAQLGSVTVLGVDSQRFGATATLRADLTDPGVNGASGIAVLVGSGRPADVGPVATGQPGAVEMVVRVGVSSSTAVENGVLVLTVEDAAGRNALLSENVPADGKEHTVRWDLAAVTGVGGKVAMPLRVASIGYRVEAPRATAPALESGTSTSPGGGDASGGPPANVVAQHPAQIVVDVIRMRTATSADGVAVNDFTPIEPKNGRLTAADATSADTSAYALAPDPTEAPSRPDGEVLRFGFTSGLLRGVPPGMEGPAQLQTVGSVSFAGVAPKELAAVVTDAFLTKSGRSVGDLVTVSSGGASVTLHIVGAVRQLPTTKAGEAAVVVDDRSLTTAIAEHSANGLPTSAPEWWVKTAPGTTAAVAAELRRITGATTVLDRESTRAELVNDPLQDGLRGALIVSAVAAILIAAVGFALYSLSAVRERTGQTAILRALGVSRRQVAAVLTTEQAYVLGVGGLAGAGLGLVTARLLVPRIALSRDGTAPAVAVLPQVPWATLAMTALIVFVVFGIAAAAVIGTTQRSAMADSLRMGEDR